MGLRILLSLFLGLQDR